MSKKILLIILAAAAFLASLYISISIDPATTEYSKKLIELHQNTEVIFIDSGLSDFAKKVEEASASEQYAPEVQEALKAYKAKLDEGIAKMIEIYDTDIDNQGKDEAGNPKTNLIPNAKAVAPDILETKSRMVLLGIDKILAITDDFEKNMPAEVKEAYDSAPVAKLKAVFNETPVEGVGGKKALRVLLILLVAAVGGTLFVLVERKARKSGEIKPSQVA